MEGNVVQLNDLFVFPEQPELDEDGRLLGSAAPTGLRPTFENSLRTRGVEFSSDMFTNDAFGVERLRDGGGGGGPDR